MTSYEFLDDFLEPILIANKDEQIIYFNSSFLALFKTTPRTMKKTDKLKDYLKLNLPDFLPFYSNLAKDSQTISSELSCSIAGHECIVIVKAVKKESGDIVLFFKDMTVEKNLNDKYRAKVEELKNTHEQIIQSDKLKIIGEMTMNISHEINNPLTVALGNVELIDFLLEKEDLNQQKTSIKKFNDNVNDSLERIKNIIINMKEFLHKNEDQREYCDAKEIVEKAISFSEHLLRETAIDLNITVEGPAPLLLVNKIKIEQVFVNLIQNAIDSLKESNVADPRIDIHLKTDESGNFVLITVNDNGPGVSTENRSKIFDNFFTTKELGKGTGLGLSISERIIQAHQGKLDLLDSTTGAHFLITLPAIGIAGHASGNWENLFNDNDKLTKVLVVDNEVAILNLCKNFLVDSGYRFLGASSAEEALVEIERASVDLVITDVKMPFIDGEKFIRGLRAKNINVPVLFMTSKDLVDKYHALKCELELKGLVVKPFTKEELVGAIRAVINE